MDYHFSFCVFYWVFFAVCLVKCWPLNHENEMATPSTKEVPVSEQMLFRNFMDALDRLDYDEYSDISFHPIEILNGEFEFDSSELQADHDVTGVDLIMKLSTNYSCRFVWAGNDIKVELRGRRINSFVLFDFDHLLVMERSSELIEIRLLPSLNCPLQNQPTNSFLVIYRNLSKGPLLQNLQELRISRIKRDSNTLPPIFSKDTYKRKNKIKSSIKDPGCHLVPWTVDFTGLQWDTFIVAPVWYEANACQRTSAKCLETQKCSLPSKKHSNYEYLRQIYSTKLGVSPPGNSSCKPSKYRSLTMLLIEPKKFRVELRTLPNMQVVECECA